MSEQPIIPPPTSGPPPPAVRQVASVRRGQDELRITGEGYDTGLRFVALTVWRPGHDGAPVQDTRRRLCLRLSEVEAVCRGLRAAADAAATMDLPERPEALALDEQPRRSVAGATLEDARRRGGKP